MTALIMSTILFFSILIGFVGFANSIIESALEKKGKKDAKPTKLIIFLETLRTGLVAEVIVDLLFVLSLIIATIIVFAGWRNPNFPGYEFFSGLGGIILFLHFSVGTFLVFHIIVKPFMMQKMSLKRGLKIGFWKNTLGSIASFIFAFIIFNILNPNVALFTVGILYAWITNIIYLTFIL